VSPLDRFAADRSAAQSAGDPWANLVVFATVDGDGAPHARVVILRDVEKRIGVFINATSPKHRQLATSPRVALVTYYATRNTQYRLGATLSPIDPAIVRRNWLLRPAIPQTMDWLYTTRLAQSAVVTSRDALIALQTTIAAELGAEPEAPETAVGYYLNVDHLDRLELANDRVHDRRRYTLTPNGWREELLVP
jgi:pyridoxamine 5'-phosphate oxidase